MVKVVDLSDDNEYLYACSEQDALISRFIESRNMTMKISDEKHRAEVGNKIIEGEKTLCLGSFCVLKSA